MNFPQQHNFQGGDGQFTQGFSQQQQQQQQQQLMMQQQQMKPVPPSMSPQAGGPGMMPGPGGGMTNPSPQHMMQVTSPPPSNLPHTVRSPQPNPSPRSHGPIPSPRAGQPSPHHPGAVHSPHPIQQGPGVPNMNPGATAGDTMMLSQLGGPGSGGGPHQGPGGPHQGLPPLQPQNSQQMPGMPPTSEPDVTPQDKLSKFVETL